MTIEWDEDVDESVEADKGGCDVDDDDPAGWLCWPVAVDNGESGKEEEEESEVSMVSSVSNL